MITERAALEFEHSVPRRHNSTATGVESTGKICRIIAWISMLRTDFARYTTRFLKAR